MWFPDKKLVIEKSAFSKGNKAIYRDKEGNEHQVKVLDVMFKSLTVGYKYLIESEEPINGQTKFLVGENSMVKKVKAEPKEKKK